MISGRIIKPFAFDTPLSRILSEIARRTPAEIDELFEAKIAPRKFRNYKTQVQINLEEKRRAGEA